MDLFYSIPLIFRVFMGGILCGLFVVKVLIPLLANAIGKDIDNSEPDPNDYKNKTKFFKIDNEMAAYQCSDEAFKRTTGMSKVTYIKNHGGLEYMRPVDLRLMIDGDDTMSRKDRREIRLELYKRETKQVTTYTDKEQ